MATGGYRKRITATSPIKCAFWLGAPGRYFLSLLCSQELFCSPAPLALLWGGATRLHVALYLLPGGESIWSAQIVQNFLPACKAHNIYTINVTLYSTGWSPTSLQLRLLMQKRGRYFTPQHHTRYQYALRCCALLCSWHCCTHHYYTHHC